MMTRNMLKRKRSPSPLQVEHSILKERKRKESEVKSKRNKAHKDSENVIGDSTAGLNESPPSPPESYIETPPPVETPSQRGGSPSIFEEPRTLKVNRFNYLNSNNVSNKFKDFHPKKFMESPITPPLREFTVKIKKKGKLQNTQKIPEFPEKENHYITDSPTRKILGSQSPPYFFEKSNSDEFLTREESPQRSRPGSPSPIKFFKMGSNKQEPLGSQQTNEEPALHLGPLFSRDENISSPVKEKVLNKKISSKPFFKILKKTDKKKEKTPKTQNHFQELPETMEVPRKATKRSGSPLPSWDQSKKRIQNVQKEIVIPRQQEDATQIEQRPHVLCLPDKISVSIKRLLKSFVTVHNASVADIKRFGRKVAHNAQKETIVSLHKDVQINELTKQMNSMYMESEEYKDNLAKLQKDYEELETNFSKANQQLLEAENHFLNKLKKSKSLYDQLNADLSTQNASHEREMNNMKEANRKLSISIKNDKKNYEAKLAENREKIKQLKTLNNKISEELKSSALEMEKVMLQKQDLESEIREMKSKLDANNKTCAELNISLERLGNEHNDALEKLHVELNNHKLHYVELEMMIDERNKQLEQVNNEINCLKTEAVEKDTAQISLQVYINELEVQREELIKSNDKLAEQLEKLRLKAAEEIKTMKETNEEIIWELRSDIDKHIKAAAEALEDKEKVEKEGLLQISQIQSKLDNLESECHELRDLKKSLENEMELKTRTWQDQEALQQQQIAELHDQYKLKVTELEGEIQREHELNESLKGVVKEKDIIINDTRKKLRDFVTANKALTNDMKIMKDEMKTIVENVSAAEKRFSDEIKLKQQDLEDFKKSLENEIELRNKNWEEQEMFLQKEFSELNDQYQNKVTEYEREAQLNISLKEVLGEKDKLINENHHKLQDLISEKEALTNDIKTINDDKQKVIDSFSAAEKRFAKELQTQEKNYKKKIEELEKAFAQKSTDWEKKEQDKDAVIAELTFKINRIGSVCDQSVGKASILKPVHIIKSTPQQKSAPKLQVVKNEAIVRPSTSKRQPIRRKVIIEQHLSDFESDNEESSSQKNRNNVTFKRPRVAANVVANVNVVEEDLFDSLKRSN